MTEEKLSELQAVIKSLKLKDETPQALTSGLPSGSFVVDILWRLCNEKAAVCSSSQVFPTFVSVKTVNQREKVEEQRGGKALSFTAGKHDNKLFKHPVTQLAA